MLLQVKFVTILQSLATPSDFVLMPNALLFVLIVFRTIVLPTGLLFGSPLGLVVHIQQCFRPLSDSWFGFFYSVSKTLHADFRAGGGTNE